MRGSHVYNSQTKTTRKTAKAKKPRNRAAQNTTLINNRKTRLEESALRRLIRQLTDRISALEDRLDGIG